MKHFVDRRRRLITVTVGACMLGFVLACYLLSIEAGARRLYISDFSVFHTSATFFWAGKDTYAPVPLDRLGHVPEKAGGAAQEDALPKLPNLNPPFFTLIVAPFGLLSYPIAHRLWSFFSLVAGCVAVILLSRATSRLEQHWSIFSLLVLLLVYFPTLATAVYAQLTLWLLLLLAVAWISSRSGNDRAAGLVLGIALSVKIYFGVFVLLFIALKRWRLLAWMLGTAVACTLLALFVLGPDSYRSYLAALSSVTWYANGWNASFLGFATRILAQTQNTTLLARGLGYGASILLVLYLMWVAWGRRNGQSVAQFDLLFSLAVVSLLLASPLGWMYYFPFLLIPLIVAWPLTKSHSMRLLSSLIIVAWVLSTIPYLATLPSAQSPVDVWVWSGSYTYALLVWLFVLHKLARISDRGAEPVSTIETIRRLYLGVVAPTDREVGP